MASETEFTRRFTAYAKQATYGPYTAMYRINPNLPVDQIAPALLAKYYNDCYHSWYQKNDKFVVEQFSEMMKVYNHHPVCLIQLLLAYSVALQRYVAEKSNLDRSTLTKLRESLSSELEKAVEAIPTPEFAPCLGCKNEYDPNKDPFCNII